MKKYLSIVLTIFIAGCYQDTIRPDLLQEYRNKMVVTSILTSGKPANLILTNSLSAIDTNSYRSIQNANIEIETSSVHAPAHTAWRTLECALAIRKR